MFRVLQVHVPEVKRSDGQRRDKAKQKEAIDLQFGRLSRMLSAMRSSSLTTGAQTLCSGPLPPTTRCSRASGALLSKHAWGDTTVR